GGEPRQARRRVGRRRDGGPGIDRTFSSLRRGAAAGGRVDDPPRSGQGVTATGGDPQAAEVAPRGSHRGKRGSRAIARRPVTRHGRPSAPGYRTRASLRTIAPFGVSSRTTYTPADAGSPCSSVPSQDTVCEPAGSSSLGNSRTIRPAQSYTRSRAGPATGRPKRMTEAWPEGFGTTLRSQRA